MGNGNEHDASRRDFFRTATLGLLGASFGLSGRASADARDPATLPPPARMTPNSPKDAPLGHLDPHAFLESFDTGRVPSWCLAKIPRTNPNR